MIAAYLKSFFARSTVDHTVVSATHHSAEIYNPFAPADRVPNEVDVRNACTRADQYARDVWFVGAMLALRAAFFNSGLALRAVDPAEQPELDEWLAESANEDRVASVHDYVRELWDAWLRQTNAISFWRDPAIGRAMGVERPLILPLHRCIYTEKLGLPKLRYLHGLNSQEIDRQVPKALQPLYRTGEVEIRPQDGQYFKVLKNAPLGAGLGLPEMKPIFPTCQAMLAMQAGDSVLAEELRVLVKQHKLGHETRYGVHAGSPANFADEPRIADVQGAFLNKTGKIEFAGGFDHKIDYTYLKGEVFDERKYDGAERILIWWAMPLPQMVMTRGGIAPFLLNILREQAEAIRPRLARHVNPILNAVYDFPCRVRAEWSDGCFVDTKMAAELIKVGLSAGPVSQRTFREFCGLNDADERARKAAEAEQPDAEKMPVFDHNHGARPDAKANGRPAA